MMYSIWVGIGITGFAVMIVGYLAAETDVWRLGVQGVATAAFFMAMHAKKGNKRGDDEVV